MVHLLLKKPVLSWVIQDDPPESKGESTGTIEKRVRLISTARFATNKNKTGEKVLVKIDDQKLIEMIATQVKCQLEKQQSHDIGYQTKFDCGQYNISTSSKLSAISVIIAPPTSYCCACRSGITCT